MKARVESMGGTTLLIMMPSTFSLSRPTGKKRLRSRMPHSSAVCSSTVRRRHWQISLRPSNAPIVMLLLPASRASSTYASCKNQSIGSIVSAHYQKTVRVQAGGGAFDDAAGLVYHDAPAGGIAGGAGEEAEDGLLILLYESVDGGDEGEQDIRAAGRAACLKAQ